MIDSEPGTMIYEANSSAATFEMRNIRRLNMRPTALYKTNAELALVAKDSSMKELYKISMIRTHCTLLDDSKQTERKNSTYQMPLPVNVEFLKFWLTWYNNVICLYQSVEGKPKKVFEYVTESSSNIGFIKFYKYCGVGPVEWIFEAPPSPRVESVSTKVMNEGHLRWVPLTSPQLPPDALIGGFEDVPLYIARARHNGSLCPGKYNPSKHHAFVAWGGREHPKQVCEILCGYNAQWVKTRGNYIPENAFAAGVSEVRREPLYVGRAVHEGNLLPGKVHVLYKTCYLPYKGKEIEVWSYEILVVPRNVRGILP